MLIEDNGNILENLTEFLQLEGFNVLAANNGKDGVELAKKFIPDLIICDVLMYGMNGHEVFQVISNSPITFAIPFIFSTSLSEKMDRAETLKLGVEDYIVKPYGLGSLLTMVNLWLKEGSKRRIPG
ncbi:MAG: response regulator [Chitinophagaceae bacterium]|nr:response regulator [Chitinophagaceae bacterium]